MEATEKTKQIHEAYLNCKEVFEPSIELADEVFHIKDEEERQFYNLLHTFFLQKKQAELVKKRVF